MSGIYMLKHHYETDTYKIGCSTNISERLTDSCYVTMFPPDKLPTLLGCYTVDGYESLSEVRYLEQAIFTQLKNKRLSNVRELFRDVKPEDITECIRNLRLNPSFRLDPPIRINLKEKQEFFFEPNNFKLYDFQQEILDKCLNYYQTNNRGKLI